MLNLFEKLVITRKPCKKSLVILKLSAIIKNSATLPRFEQGYPTYIKEHSDTKIKCVQQVIGHQRSY